VSNWASWVNFDLSPYRAVIAYRENVGAHPAVVGEHLALIDIYDRLR